jgi:hypothetical protein
MPAPTSERQALERERGELTEQLAIYQATLDLTPPEHTARRESLMWQIRRVWKRLAEIEARLTAISVKSG